MSHDDYIPRYAFAVYQSAHRMSTVRMRKNQSAISNYNFTQLVGGRVLSENGKDDIVRV